MAFISPRKRQSANFVWQQQAANYTLDLNTFIGTNVMHLARSDADVRLEVDGEQYQGDNAQILVYQLTGLDLPLSQPQEWLLAQRQDNAQIDELGRITSRTWVSSDKRQWQINYADYQPWYGVWLPSRITLTHDSLRVKLLINHWQVQ